MARRFGDSTILAAAACGGAPGSSPRRKCDVADPASTPENEQTVVFNITDILRILPHRFPFLMVDRIIELESGKRIVGLKNVTINEPFFQGHFPGVPVMPGVLVIEAMAQVAGIMTYAEEPGIKDKLIYFTGIENAKFRRPVIPGDQLRIEMELLNRRNHFGTMKGRALVAGRLVAEATVRFAIVDRPAQ
jgi:beta-hydroxyacyl-ACP dehydratase FabZ